VDAKLNAAWNMRIFMVAVVLIIAGIAIAFAIALGKDR